MNAYVICKKCREKIFLVVKCRIEAPLIFKATCPICNSVSTYSYIDIIESDKVCEEARQLYSTIHSTISKILIARTIISNLNTVKTALKEMVK